MFLALTVLAIGLHQASTKLEILGNNFQGRTLYAHVASPDAKKIVCRFGNGEVSGQVGKLDGDDVEVIDLVDGWETTDCVAVSNKGSVLFNVSRIVSVQSRSKTSIHSAGWSLVRAYTYDGDSVNWLIDDPDLAHGLTAVGFGQNGRIWAQNVPRIATPLMGPVPGQDLVELGSGGFRPIFHNDAFSMSLPRFVSDLVLGGNPGSFVGRFTYDHGPGSVISKRLTHAAYFRDGRAFLLEPSNPILNTDAYAATLDGRTVAGSIDKAAMVWRDGAELHIPQSGASRRNIIIRSLNEAGTIGVGSVDYVNRPADAQIWREKEGFGSLEAYLREQKVEIPDGWTLIDAVSISDDGLSIVGSATNKKKLVRPFRVVFPKPKK